MQAGDAIQVKAYKSDGTCYRWWPATVEAVTADVLITIAPVGKRVEDSKGGWISEVAIRTFYWLNKPYSLLEIYTQQGQLGEIYVNINSLVQIEPGQLSYIRPYTDLIWCILVPRKGAQVYGKTKICRD